MALLGCASLAQLMPGATLNDPRIKQLLLPFSRQRCWQGGCRCDGCWAESPWRSAFTTTSPGLPSYQSLFARSQTALLAGRVPVWPLLGCDSPALLDPPDTPPQPCSAAAQVLSSVNPSFDFVS